VKHKPCIAAIALVLRLLPREYLESLEPLTDASSHMMNMMLCNKIGSY